jgi:hypothetical protein
MSYVTLRSELYALAVMTTAPCELHHHHVPRPDHCEQHHVIPVDIQQAVTPGPGADLHPGHDFSGRGQLWDDRIEIICPTGHRNVHAIWVRAMRWIEATVDVAQDEALADRALHVARNRLRAEEVACVKRGMMRLLAAGADLRALAAAGHVGQA